MKENCDKFNDVIVYDSTYGTNRFWLQLGLFIGCNNLISINKK